MIIPRRSPIRSRCSAFTLIELLVVISIISLLMALLLPSLSGARRTGQRVACLATMRQIASGAANYAAENDDYILGGPGTSGSYMYQRSSTNPDGSSPNTPFGPAVQRWDFMGILAKMWGLGFAENSGAGAQGIQPLIRRFNDIRNSEAFLCKSNTFLASQFDGPGANTEYGPGVGRMISFNTVRTQLFISARTGTAAGFKNDPQGCSWYNGGNPNDPSGDPSTNDEFLPKGWKPIVSRLGVAANKVFCADGSRFSTRVVRPDYDLRNNATWGGAFSDAGSYLKLSRAYDRSMAPGATGGPQTTGDEARFYAFRHSTGIPQRGAAADVFKLNLVFHDGHAETQGDLQSTNIHQWLPQGARMKSMSNVWNDTVKRFGFVAGMRVGP